MKVGIAVIAIWIAIWLVLMVGLIRAWRLLLGLRRERRDWEFRNAVNRKIREDEWKHGDDGRINR